MDFHHIISKDSFSSDNDNNNKYLNLNSKNSLFSSIPQIYKQDDPKKMEIEEEDYGFYSTKGGTRMDSNSLQSDLEKKIASISLSHQPLNRHLDFSEIEIGDKISGKDIHPKNNNKENINNNVINTFNSFNNSNFNIFGNGNNQNSNFNQFKPVSDFDLGFDEVNNNNSKSKKSKNNSGGSSNLINNNDSSNSKYSVKGFTPNSSSKKSTSKNTGGDNNKEVSAFELEFDSSSKKNQKKDNSPGGSSDCWFEERDEFKLIRRHSSLHFSLNTPKFDEDYVIIKTLCEGEMGKVYLCSKFQDKRIYVVKVTKYFTSKFDYYNMKELVDTVKRNLSDPSSMFIQSYVDFWIEDLEGGGIDAENYDLNDNKNCYKNIKNISNNKSTYIVTDYCSNGNLEHYLEKLKSNKINGDFKLNSKFYWDIIFEMIASVAFLHSLGYIHFDIKPTNFLVKENGQLLLSDFCLSVKEKEIKKLSTEELEGDAIYIAPEVFYKDVDFINRKSDIYSLGLSILEILTDIKLPKNGLDWQLMRAQGIPKEMIDKIFLSQENADDAKKFVELIKAMTDCDCSKRPDLKDLLNNKNYYKELYERFQLLNENKYLPSLNPSGFINFKDSFDFTFENVGKRYAKRSDSMKICDKVLKNNE